MEQKLADFRTRLQNAPADEQNKLYVEVATYNANAIKFYEKLGFVDTGRRFSDERFRMQSGALLPEMEMVLKQGDDIR